MGENPPLFKHDLHQILTLCHPLHLLLDSLLHNATSLPSGTHRTCNPSLSFKYTVLASITIFLHSAACPTHAPCKHTWETLHSLIPIESWPQFCSTGQLSLTHLSKTGCDDTALCSPCIQGIHSILCSLTSLLSPLTISLPLPQTGSCCLPEPNEVYVLPPS